jgi:hypothetical protein
VQAVVIAVLGAPRRVDEIRSGDLEPISLRHLRRGHRHEHYFYTRDEEMNETPDKRGKARSRVGRRRPSRMKRLKGPSTGALRVFHALACAVESVCHVRTIERKPDLIRRSWEREQRS